MLPVTDLFLLQFQQTFGLHSFSRKCNEHLQFSGVTFKMKQDEIREKLIAGTIRVVARDGLDKASAKQIEAETGLNVAYIYRCFKDKDDMFAKTFSMLSIELRDALAVVLPVMANRDILREERCWQLFAPVWKFVLGNEEKCLYYRRYHYSAYFHKYSVKEHMEIFKDVIAVMGEYFQPGTDAGMILGHILNVTLDFAVKVFSGEIKNNDETAKHVFNLVFHSLTPYFRER